MPTRTAPAKPRRPAKPAAPRKPPSRSRAKQAAPAPAASNARLTGNIHLYVGISLDGYIADPDGGVEWLSSYADARSGFTPFIKTIKACIMGRTTYDHAVSKYGGLGGGGMPSYVITHRPLESKSGDLIPYGGDLRKLVSTMRQKHPGGDFWLMGGGGVTRSFLDDDLIDILSVAFVPTLLGAGLPMFPTSDLRERRLRLVKQHTYPSGVVELRYERA